VAGLSSAATADFSHTLLYGCSAGMLMGGVLIGGVL